MYLYVKTHNVTGLKYLGKTTQLDPHCYTGSGTRWLAHLNKHGYDYTTEILLETDDKEKLKEQGIYYSNLWNIVDSKEWANLVIEQGDGGDTSWSPGTQEYNKNRKGKYCGADNHFFGKKHSVETKNKLSKLASKQWKNVPKSIEHRQKIALALTGQVFTEERKQKISAAKKGKVAHNKGISPEKFLCQHCNREIAGASNFKRWHGDNCRKKL